MTPLFFEKCNSKERERENYFFIGEDTPREYLIKVPPVVETLNPQMSLKRYLFD